MKQNLTKKKRGIPLSKATLLVIEDNSVIQKGIVEVLTKEGYHVHTVTEGRQGLDFLTSQEVDGVLLDLKLPDIDGDEVLANIRKHSSVPVMIISIKDSDIDKAIHLGLGADDYLVKPFSTIELIARVKALLRRTQMALSSASSTKSVHGIVFHLENYEAFRGQEQIPFTMKEAQILTLLLNNPNITFTKKQIYEAVWNDEYFQDDNVINVHIRRIREKIEKDPSNPKIVQTVWGIGYQFRSSEV